MRSLLSIFKTIQGKMTRLDSVQDGCWVNLTYPSEDELNTVAVTLGVEPSFLRAALDEEETSRIDTEDGQTLIIIDVPAVEKDDAVVYSTLPLGIIVTDKHIITVCLKETSILKDFQDGLVRFAETQKRTSFILYMLLQVAKRFLQYLKQIDKIYNYMERQLYKSQRNKELIQLLDLEKSLVYFNTSLKANEVTLEKILRGRIITLYEEDHDLLEDVLLRCAPAIEEANIHPIISGMMDAAQHLQHPNVIIMKVLTSITILLTIPNIFLFYGMNVANLPRTSSVVPAGPVRRDPGGGYYPGKRDLDKTVDHVHRLNFMRWIHILATITVILDYIGEMIIYKGVSWYARQSGRMEVFMASNPNYCDITPEIEALAAQSLQNSSIDAGDYVKYDVKRGLRDLNGKGVPAGLTEISDIIAKKMVDGQEIPCDGKLYYRGIDVEKLVAGAPRRGGSVTRRLPICSGRLPNAAGAGELLKPAGLLSVPRHSATSCGMSFLRAQPGYYESSPAALEPGLRDERCDDISPAQRHAPVCPTHRPVPGTSVYGCQAYTYKSRNSLYIHAPSRS